MVLNRLFGGGAGGGLGDMMKQAIQAQEKLQKMQEELARTEVVGEAGAGLVKVTMNGRHDVSRVQIDEELLQEDKQLLEDLLAAAVNSAVRRVEEAQKEHMGQLASGLGLPPGFKPPFQL